VRVLFCPFKYDMKFLTLFPTLGHMAYACLIGALPVGAAHAETVEHGNTFDYGHQNEWHRESGDAQSPIAIRRADVRNAEQDADENDAIVVHVKPTDSTVIDNGHTVQVNPVDSTATIRGRHFTMVQAHFHAPSEHTIDGKHYPIEGHFVFKAQDGRLAVLAVLYREGAENAQFAAIMQTVKSGVATPLPVFDAAALMPKPTDAYFHYLGSLTTPPLTENVEWYVFVDPVELSARDIALFTQRYAHNARQVQPLNGRPLLLYRP
jgi:carbonic anhydrase